MKIAQKTGSWTHPTGSISRRELLKFIGAANIVAAMPISLICHALAFSREIKGVDLQRSGIEHPDWLAEARIYGLAITGFRVDPVTLGVELDSALAQGANVIEADSRLSDYLPDKEFALELQRVKETARLVHERGMKVVWYIPSLKVITPNGRLRSKTIARQHPDWLQLSFDREQRGVFYGHKAFGLASNDEHAWMCPNSPYRDWFYNRLRRLAAMGIDGVWLDVPLLGSEVAKWGCACSYCREKFNHQTEMEFPTKFDVTDARFWRYVQWRHDTLTEFLVGCQKSINEVNSNTATIAAVVALDHLGATEWGTEGSAMSSHFVVWKQDGASETTGMAEASYDDWIAQYNTYKYCRGATMDRPSWVTCPGFNDPDAQLVMAAAVAAQNNPYELRVPKMTTTVGMEFRGLMYNWIANYSKLIFRSQSLSPVAIIYSARNRDFLDTLFTGGMIVSGSGKHRDRQWLGRKEGSPIYQEYMGDYRGLSIMLYQNQIPADIYPINRIDVNLLRNYPVLVLPYMAIVTETEKEMLLQAVREGATLIVSGPKSGKWNPDGTPRKTSIWIDLLRNANGGPISRYLGKGRVCFWRNEVGRNYLKTHSEKITTPIMSWIKDTGVEPWIREKHRVVIQPYVYNKQIIIHVLNYAWTGSIESTPEPVSLELVVPWEPSRHVKRIIQSEPKWEAPKKLDFSESIDKLAIPLKVGINALVVIQT